MTIRQSLTSFWNGLPRFRSPRRRQRLHWPSTSPAMESLEPRQLLSAVTGAVSGQEMTTEIDVQFTDSTGRIIDQVQLGDSFQVDVLVRDLRAVPQGVVAAFVDVIYDTDVIDVTSIVHHYQLGQDGRIDDSAGLVDDAGGGQLEPPASSAPQRLLSLTATAIRPCRLTIQTRAADGPDAIVALAGLDTDQRDRTLFGQATLTVVRSPDSPPEAMYDLDGDGRISFGDLTVFAESFGEAAESSYRAWLCDFDSSGQVGGGDFAQFAPVVGQKVDGDRSEPEEPEGGVREDVGAQLPQQGSRSIVAETVDAVTAETATAVISDDDDAVSIATQTADQLALAMDELQRLEMLTATCTHNPDIESCDHQNGETTSDVEFDETNVSLTSIRGDVLDDEMPSP